MLFMALVLVLFLLPGSVAAGESSLLRGSRSLSDIGYDVPEFDIDYQDCSATMETAAGSVKFYDSSASSSASGRVVSSKAYKSIERITFDLDLSGMPSSSQFGAFKIPTVYLISSATQPIGTNYCDQGGNKCGSACLEVDLFEGNGGLVGQTTIHTGESGGSDGCGGKQAWQIWSSESAWADVLSSGCSGSKPSGTGVQELSWSPADVASMSVNFTSSKMTMSLTSGDVTTTVFDSTASMGTGSNTVDFSLVDSANSDVGFWIIASWWSSGSWAPANSVSTLDYDSGECSGCDWTCDCGAGWGFSNLKVYSGDSSV